MIHFALADADAARILRDALVIVRAFVAQLNARYAAVVTWIRVMLQRASTKSCHAVTVLDVAVPVRLADFSQTDGLVTPSFHVAGTIGTLTDLLSTLRVRSEGHATLNVRFTGVSDSGCHFQAAHVGPILIYDVILFAQTGLLLPAIRVPYAVDVVLTLS